jgi:hypothetical protein
LLSPTKAVLVVIIVFITFFPDSLERSFMITGANHGGCWSCYPTEALEGFSPLIGGRLVIGSLNPKMADQASSSGVKSNEQDLAKLMEELGDTFDPDYGL